MTVSEAGRRGGKATGEKHKKRVTWGAGRPTNLTPELAEQICNEIADTACSFHTAAIAAGVAWQTVWQWEQWGRQGKQPYAEFTALVMQARALAELGLLRRMHFEWDRGRDGRGQLALLERRYPEDYGQRVKWEQQLAELTDEQLTAAIQANRAVLAGLAGEGGEAAALPTAASEPEPE